MRLLILIAHYFKASQGVSYLGSGDAPIAKIAALNAAIVALHRYFGPNRSSLNKDDLQGQSSFTGDVLDIVVMTRREGNLLEHIGIDNRAYSVNYCNCDPEMLPFEAQRIMHERSEEYDMYAYMEDDLVVDDPAFFSKIAWFAGEFGPRAILLPIRYELSSTGLPAKISLSVRLSTDDQAPFRRREAPEIVCGRWNGAYQSFVRPTNPHAGCYVLTSTQLSDWIASSTFFDRDRSWIGPLESGATLAVGKEFAIYMPSTPDPWFLQIEHYGVRLSAAQLQQGALRGGPLLLALLESSADIESDELHQKMPSISKAVSASARRATNEVLLRDELHDLKNSRSRLIKALAAAYWRKMRR